MANCPVQRLDLMEGIDMLAHLPHPDLPDSHQLNRSPVDGANRWPSESRPQFREAMLR